MRFKVNTLDTSDLITLYTEQGLEQMIKVRVTLEDPGVQVLSESDWLKSLKGSQGLKGDTGETGPKGETGAAFTYDMFTPEQLEALKGPKGDKGDKGETGSVDTSNFYTKSEVDQKLLDVTSGGEIDLSEYAKTEDIPTKTSELTNDSGFLTQHQDISGKADKSELFSGDYNDLTNKPTIPAVDLTKAQADELYQAKGNYLTEHQSLNNYYTKQDTYSKTETDNAISTAVANIPTSENQVQSDWDYNSDRNNLAYVKNKPVGKFKVYLVKEFTDVAMGYSSFNKNSYYYISAYSVYNKRIVIDNSQKFVNCYPSSEITTPFLLRNSNGELLNEAPEWLIEDIRFIIEVDGKKVLCNSGNERNFGIRGEFTATAKIEKVTCEYDSDGNKLDTPKDIFDI